jgi:hypothetical protein
MAHLQRVYDSRFAYNEGNMPIGPLSTANQLANSVGDQTEENVWEQGDPESRRRRAAAELERRYAYDGARGQTVREKHLATSHYPIASGDRIPVPLINNSGPRAGRFFGGINAMAIRRSVMNRQDPYL